MENIPKGVESLSTYSCHYIEDIVDSQDNHVHLADFCSRSLKNKSHTILIFKALRFYRKHNVKNTTPIRKLSTTWRIVYLQLCNACYYDEYSTSSGILSQCDYVCVHTVLLVRESWHCVNIYDIVCTHSVYDKSCICFSGVSRGGAQGARAPPSALTKYSILCAKTLMAQPQH